MRHLPPPAHVPLDVFLRAQFLHLTWGLPTAVTYRATRQDLDEAGAFLNHTVACACLGCLADALAVARTAVLRYPPRHGEC